MGEPTPDAPRVSVVVAAYQPGDAVDRVVDSLDAQTLPQDEFEVIFVDDGSPDDTYARLQRIAATRPNYQVHRIPNSGWPSRPRNVGIEHARGEYVTFMDHDDSLYPDGLRRAYDYAARNSADVLSPKESRTSDVWWAMSALLDGNVPDAYADGGIARLNELVPHKLYRRQFLLDKGIRFVEGSRVLWEDQLINVAAYRHASRISVLADTPFYLWHASEQNTTHTFDPARTDFWDRLGELMHYIEDTLDTEPFRDARTYMLAEQVSGRILDRLAKLLVTADAPTASMAVGRAAQLLNRFTSDAVLAALRSKKHRAQAYLLRAGRADLIRDSHLFDLGCRASVEAVSARWEDGRVRLEIASRWEPKDAAAPLLERAGGRVRLAVGEELRRAVPPELLDVTDDADAAALLIGIRDRSQHVTWALPYRAVRSQFGIGPDGALSLLGRGVSELDLETSAVGAPVVDDVWDFRFRSEWLGPMRKGAVGYVGTPGPALVRGRAAAFYANAGKGLTIDLAQRMRTLAIDAKPRSGPAGRIDAFTVSLPNVTVVGTSNIEADMLVAIPHGRVPDGLPAEHTRKLLDELAVHGQLGARIVADRDGARLVGSASLPPGRYVIYARRDGVLHKTNRALTVDDARQAVFG